MGEISHKRCVSARASSPPKDGRFLRCHGDLERVYFSLWKPTFLGGSVGAWGNERAFLVAKRRAELFVTLSTFHARQGEEDAVIALHEAWQRHQQPHARGYLSGELLRNVMDSREFIAIMRFENQEAAQALTNDPEREAWYQRVVSLTEKVPTLAEYTSEWP
jgi:heme-degrading monooxygenase HmoA